MSKKEFYKKWVKTKKVEQFTGQPYREPLKYIECYYPELLWTWIEEEIKQARIDELKRSIDMFMSLPTTDYSDLMLKDVVERRIKELEKL